VATGYSGLASRVDCRYLHRNGGLRLWPPYALAILQAEAAAGIYEKPIDMFAREVHYEPLPAEVRTVVIAAWTRGALLPRAAIEQIVPERVLARSCSAPEHQNCGQNGVSTLST
jgi:hypothetical protein